MTKTDQKKLVVLVSAYVNQQNCTRKAIIDYIGTNNWINLTAAEAANQTKDHRVSWKVSLAYIRKALTPKYIKNDNENQWQISKDGIGEMILLYQECKDSSHDFLSSKFMDDAGKIIGDILVSSPRILKTKKINIIPTETEKEAIVKQRIGQGPFKRKLVARSHTCQLCGLSCEKLLIASHIKPWSKCEKDEKLDINNGLLLCAPHDSLFDKGLISFSETGEIIISNALTEMDRKLLHIDLTMKIEGINTDNQYFNYHRDHVFKSNY